MSFLTAGRGAYRGVAACGGRGYPCYEPPQDAAQRGSPAPGHLREAAGAGGIGVGVLGRDRVRKDPASLLPLPRAVSSPVPPALLGATAALLTPGARRQPRNRPWAWKFPRS